MVPINISIKYFLFYFLRFYLFLESREGMEKERKRNINVWLPLAAPLTGDLASNPGMCSDWESNQRPLSSQASMQSTEPHQPVLHHILISFFKRVQHGHWGPQGRRWQQSKGEDSRIEGIWLRTDSTRLTNELVSWSE